MRLNTYEKKSIERKKKRTRHQSTKDTGDLNENRDLSALKLVSIQYPAHWNAYQSQTINGQNCIYIISFCWLEFDAVFGFFVSFEILSWWNQTLHFANRIHFFWIPVFCGENFGKFFVAQSFTWSFYYDLILVHKIFNPSQI